MKKMNLKKLRLGSYNELERSQMKSILGGYVNDEGSPDGCSVTCGSGFFACCNDKSGVLTKATCKCYGNSQTEECNSGGSGNSSCSIT
jgi:natural product precursor